MPETFQLWVISLYKETKFWR